MPVDPSTAPTPQLPGAAPDAEGATPASSGYSDYLKHRALRTKLGQTRNVRHDNNRTIADLAAQASKAPEKDQPAPVSAEPTTPVSGSGAPVEVVNAVSSGPGNQAQTSGNKLIVNLKTNLPLPEQDDAWQEILLAAEKNNGGNALDEAAWAAARDEYERGAAESEPAPEGGEAEQPAASGGETKEKPTAQTVPPGVGGPSDQETPVPAPKPEGGPAQGGDNTPTAGPDDKTGQPVGTESAPGETPPEQSKNAAPEAPSSPADNEKPTDETAEKDQNEDNPAEQKNDSDADAANKAAGGEQPSPTDGEQPAAPGTEGEASPAAPEAGPSAPGTEPPAAPPEAVNDLNRDKAAQLGAERGAQSEPAGANDQPATANDERLNPPEQVPSEGGAGQAAGAPGKDGAPPEAAKSKDQGGIANALRSRKQKLKKARDAIMKELNQMQGKVDSIKKTTSLRIIRFFLPGIYAKIEGMKYGLENVTSEVMITALEARIGILKSARSSLRFAQILPGAEIDAGWIVLKWILRLLGIFFPAGIVLAIISPVIAIPIAMFILAREFIKPLRAINIPAAPLVKAIGDVIEDINKKLKPLEEKLAVEKKKVYLKNKLVDINKELADEGSAGALPNQATISAGGKTGGAPPPAPAPTTPANAK